VRFHRLHLHCRNVEMFLLEHTALHPEGSIYSRILLHVPQVFSTELVNAPENVVANIILLRQSPTVLAVEETSL